MFLLYKLLGRLADYRSCLKRVPIQTRNYTGITSELHLMMKKVLNDVTFHLPSSSICVDLEAFGVEAFDADAFPFGVI
jgi:hypothetical protein